MKLCRRDLFPFYIQKTKGVIKINNKRNAIQDYSIEEIVEELSKRDGVEIDELNSYSGMNLDIEGPAIVIVINK